MANRGSLSSIHAQVPLLSTKTAEKPPDFSLEARIFLYKNGFKKVAQKIAQCGTTWAMTKCPNGHQKGIRIRCRNPLCPVCGHKGSSAHARRVIRAKDRLFHFTSLGQLVFTMPSMISKQKPCKKDLLFLKKQIWRIVKKNFDTPGGMEVMQLVGDRTAGPHIHWHVVFGMDAACGTGRVNKKRLFPFKRQWAEVLNKRYGLNLKEAVVNYNYAFEDGKKMHIVKYALRNALNDKTFYSCNDEEKKYIMSLQKTHHVTWHGELGNNKYKEFLTARNIDPVQYKETELLTRKLCLVCGLPYRFEGIIAHCHLPVSQGVVKKNDIFIDKESAAVEKMNDDFQKYLSGETKIEKIDDCPTGPYSSNFYFESLKSNKTKRKNNKLNGCKKFCESVSQLHFQSIA